jgi:hypothetical protein
MIRAVTKGSGLASLIRAVTKGSGALPQYQTERR